MEIKLRLKGSMSTGWPTCKIIINDVVHYDGIIENDQTISFAIQPRDLNILQIVHYGKQNSDTIVNEQHQIIADKSLELQGITLDNVEVMTVNLYNCPFYVQWPSSKLREFMRKGEEPPNFIKQQLYFGFNGTYEFTFNGDLQKEYFNQFWLDECQSNENQTLENDKFNRLGEYVDINAPLNMTIYELEKLIKQ